MGRYGKEQRESMSSRFTGASDRGGRKESRGDRASTGKMIVKTDGFPGTRIGCVGDVFSRDSVGLRDAID